MFFICNLISFSCTLCLCYCFLLLTNLKYGLGKNSTKSFNCRAAHSVMPCLGCASLKLTSIDCFLYASLNCRAAHSVMPCLGCDSPGATRICSLLVRGTCRFGFLGTKS